VLPERSGQEALHPGRQTARLVALGLRSRLSRVGDNLALGIEDDVGELGGGSGEGV
jgi:hypothetical protein